MGSLVNRLFIVVGFAGALLAVARLAYPDTPLYASMATAGEAVVAYEALFGKGWWRQLFRALLWLELAALPLSVLVAAGLDGPRMALLTTTAALALVLLFLGEFTFMPRRKSGKGSGSGS